MTFDYCFIPQLIIHFINSPEKKKIFDGFYLFVHLTFINEKLSFFIRMISVVPLNKYK